MDRRCEESLEADLSSITNEQREELEYRVTRYYENPSNLISWEHVKQICVLHAKDGFHAKKQLIPSRHEDYRATASLHSNACPKIPTDAMHQGALPLSQQLALDIIIPPAGSLLGWLMSRAWASVVQGRAASETTRKRQKKEALVLLIAVYVLMFGITIYARST